MIVTPKPKKLDLKNSTGYISFITRDDNVIHKLEINSISEGSPLIDFILKNNPDNIFKELSPNIYIKLVEKNIDLKYCETTNNLITKTNDMNCPNKTGVVSNNHLNYIYYYYPDILKKNIHMELYQISYCVLQKNIFLNQQNIIKIYLINL